MSDKALLPLGTKTQWGEVVGVQFFQNERYYFIIQKGSVALMPAAVVERVEEERTP